MIRKMKEKKQAELKKQKKHVFMKVCAAFAAGSLISTVVTLFTAPKSGKEMRHDVKDKVYEGAELLKDNASKSIRKLGDTIGNAVGATPSIKDKFFKCSKEKVAEPLEEVKDDILYATEDIYDEIKNYED